MGQLIQADRRATLTEITTRVQLGRYLRYLQAELTSIEKENSHTHTHSVNDGFWGGKVMVTYSDFRKNLLNFDHLIYFFTVRKSSSIFL